MNQRRRGSDQFLLFAGVPNDGFASRLAEEIGVPLSPLQWSRFKGAVPTGGETKPEIKCNVSRRDCAVVWSPYNTNDELVQVCLLLRALEKGEAEKITLVVPCFPYARQDKSHGKREPISARWVADVLEMSGMARIVYVDIHADQIEGFFTHAKVRGLWMDNIYLDYLGARLPAIVSHFGIQADKVRAMPPDEGAVGPNYRISKAMEHELAVHLKKRDWSQAHSVVSMGIAGDVVSCLVYTRDDLCASGDSLFAAAEHAKDKGAKYVIALVTHTLGFDKDGAEKTFVEKLNASCLDEFVTTNSLFDFTKRVLRTGELQKKVSILDITPYIAQVLSRLGPGATIREMMREIQPSNLYRVAFSSEQARAIEAAGLPAK